MLLDRRVCASHSLHLSRSMADGEGGKESTCQCRRGKGCGLIPGSGRSPGVGNGNPFQYSCLENSTNRGTGGLQPMGLQSQTWLSAHIHKGGGLLPCPVKKCNDADLGLDPRDIQYSWKLIQGFNDLGICINRIKTQYTSLLNIRQSFVMRSKAIKLV